MFLIQIHLVCLLLISCVTCYEVTDQIDFEKNCNVQMYVHDSSIVEIFAYPQSGVLPEISSCQTRLVATPSDRKLVLYIHEFFLGPGACGHKLKIYDGDRFQNDPDRELTCNSPLTTYTSNTNEIIISFTKPSVDTSTHYKFNIKVTTDRDEPYLLFVPFKKPAYRLLQHRKRRESENIPSYTAPLTGAAGGSGGGGLTSGAIAGIAVGCVVGAVIIIAICIYALWKFLRQAEEKKRYGANEPPPVFVTSQPSMSNCGIAPGSSRRSFKTHSRVAFSDISKKSDIDSTSSDAISKSKSSKSYDNHGYSHDGASVSSSNIKEENQKVDKSRLNDPIKDDFVREKKDRGSYRKERIDEDVNYPDVVDSARKSEKEKQRRENISSKDGPSRENSMKRSVRNKNTGRSESLKRNERDCERTSDRVNASVPDRGKDISKRHKSRDNYEYDSDDRGRYNDRDDRRQKRDRYQSSSHQNDSRKHRYKTESEYTDDSGATYLSSVSDRYHDNRDRRSRPHDRSDNRKYDDHTRLRDSKRSERSSSQKRGRSDSHRRRNRDDEDEWEDERARPRREERHKQRSHSASRARSYHDQFSDYEKSRDSYRDQRSRRDDERDTGFRRQHSSRSQSGRQRSRSSFR